ncbi:MAG: Abi family protein [Gallintestinimicrobium sp.]
MQNAIAAAYRKENPKITHFYNNVNYNEVPIWAIFEILTMGDFGYLLSCLTIDMREKVSRSIGEYYGTAEPPVRCGESHLSGLTEPLHFVY